MKLAQTMSKNLKLLFRSKETAFTIIFGPLLIILLVGFAFSGSQDFTITLGVHSPDYTELTDEIIQSLNAKEYIVNIYSTEDECVQHVKDGDTHMCILFPEDFTVRENHTNTVEFNVDPSRVNLVYAVIDELSTEFGIQSSAVSYELTNKILTRISATKDILQEQRGNAARIQELRTNAEGSLEKGEDHVQAESINFTVMDLRLVRGRATGLQQDSKQLYDLANENIDRALSTLNDAKKNIDDNQSIDAIEVAIDEFEEARQEVNAIYEENPEKLAAISSQIDGAAAAISSIETDYDGLIKDTQFVNKQLTSALGDLQQMKQPVTEIKGSLEYTYEFLDSIEIAEAGSIVSPISTAINPVTTEESNLTFTYPYVLMLVIMFMGLMLGSTLIVMDKNSRAAFRNFTTATRDEFHIFMSFFTTLLILLAQVFIILLFSYFMVSTPLLNNFGTSLLVLLIAISLWSFLGMIIGYLSHSQESAMIASLTIGSISLFVSNLVIPIEGMHHLIKLFTLVNPYVILSELLKKSILFGIGIGYFGGQLLVVLGIMIVLFIAVLSIQKYVRNRYFAQQRTIEVKPIKKAVKALDLLGHHVKDEYDLITVLDLMTRKDFQELVNDKQNIIADWIRDELGNKKLAAKLRTTNKERMILKLDKHIRRMTKKLSKK